MIEMFSKVTIIQIIGPLAGCILLYDFMKGIAMESYACPSCTEQGIFGFTPTTATTVVH
jgi:hypothetical protein